MFWVRATIFFPSDQVESWVFDLDDPDQRADFGRRADGGVRAGATVTLAGVTEDAIEIA